MHCYMFLGRRLEIMEKTESAIKRELDEKSRIHEQVILKIVSEIFFNFRKENIMN